MNGEMEYEAKIAEKAETLRCEEERALNRMLGIPDRTSCHPRLPARCAKARRKQARKASRRR